MSPSEAWTASASQLVRASLLKLCENGDREAIELWFKLFEDHQQAPQHVHQHLTIEAREKLDAFRRPS